MPLLVSVSPYVSQRSSPYAGHQWYFHFLEALGRSYDVVTLAPNTCENHEALAGAPSETHLVPGLGHWRSSELQQGALDKLGDELLRGVLHLDAPARQLLQSAAVVDLEWPRALPHASVLRAEAPDAVLGYVAHDLHYTNSSWDRLRALPNRKRFALWGVGRVVRARELHMMKACDVLFAFKQADLDAVRRAGVTIPGIRLSPWLQQPSSGRATGDGREVLYVAAFDRAQNRWGADWLLEQVWPAVVAEVPEARLVLAGAGAPTDLHEAACRSHNVTLTGFVEDLDPFYQRAACVVAPVLGGAGLRFKVPQAMLYGRPLVVTHLALEGLEAASRDCFAAVTDDPRAFARAVISTLRRTPAALRAARLAREWVQSELSFERSMAAVLEAYQRALPDK
jgi:glycosyltransferase involved in cell wall biosynthesis